MAPRKSWMDLVDDRISDECLDGNTSKKEIYDTGVINFLNYAISRTRGGDEIKCPCIKCCNTYSMSREVVYSHLKAFGIIRNYRFWYHHGEVLGEAETDSEDLDDYISHGSDEHGHSRAEDVLMDLFAERFNPIKPDLDPSNPDGSFEEPNAEAVKFYNLLDELNKPLYEGLRTSKLSAVVKLLNTKNLGKWSKKSYSMLMDILCNDLLPDNSYLPTSYYETKKIMKEELGLSYQKIDACKNDCMLYWKDDIDAQSCKVCKRSRWKKNKHSGE